MVGCILGLQGLASNHTVTIGVNYNVPEALNIVKWHLNYGTYIFTFQMRARFMHNVLLLLQCGFLLA